MKNRKVVVSIVGTILLLLGMTAQMSFVSAQSHDIITLGPNQQGVEFTGINDLGRDISAFTIEIAKSALTNITGVYVESDQYGGCGDWDLDDDEDGRSQEEMEQDDWDSTPKSAKTMWTWYTRVDCMGKDGPDGVPIRKGEQYTIRILFTEKTKNNAYIYIYASTGDNFQIAGVDIIGQEKNEPEKAAQILSDMITIPETSEVFFVGPVGSGTVLRESCPIDDEEPVELKIPDAPGTYYAFYIDDMPGFMFVHGVRYAWVNVETKEYNVVDALWWPQILEPGVTPAPFGLIKSYQILGVSFKYGEGGGTGHVNNIVHKPDAKPSLTSREFNCIAIALVIDGGDTDKWWGKGGDLADNLAEHADSIKYYLIANEYGLKDVKRISQYWGNKDPCIRNDPKDGTMNEQLKEIIEGFAQDPNPPKEFFLYIDAHGNESGFALFDSTGSGKREFIWYSELYTWLSEFPETVNIVIFIDSCRSGGAIDELKKLENVSIGKRTGLTIMTATDDKTSADGGQRTFPFVAKTDSATEDFLEGRNADLNKDGKIGDLGDCWKSLQNESAGYHPQCYTFGRPSILGDINDKSCGARTSKLVRSFNTGLIASGVYHSMDIYMNIITFVSQGAIHYFNLKAHTLTNTRIRGNNSVIYENSIVFLTESP